MNREYNIYRVLPTIQVNYLNLISSAGYFSPERSFPALSFEDTLTNDRVTNPTRQAMAAADVLARHSQTGLKGCAL